MPLPLSRDTDGAIAGALTLEGGLEDGEPLPVLETGFLLMLLAVDAGLEEEMGLDVAAAVVPSGASLGTSVSTA